MGPEAVRIMEDQKNREVSGKAWSDWMKEGVFYIYGMVYMLARLNVNVTMTVQPFYLNKVAKFEQTEDNPTPVPLAVVPLISYLMSMIFSMFFQRRLTKMLKNRMLPILVSIVILCLASVPLFILTKSNRDWVYLISGI